VTELWEASELLHAGVRAGHVCLQATAGDLRCVLSNPGAEPAVGLLQDQLPPILSWYSIFGIQSRADGEAGLDARCAC